MIMNIKSCRLKSRTEQEEGCQDPGETMVKPPLKASIFSHLYKAGESCSGYILSPP